MTLDHELVAMAPRTNPSMQIITIMKSCAEWTSVQIIKVLIVTTIQCIWLLLLLIHEFPCLYLITQCHVSTTHYSKYALDGSPNFTFTFTHSDENRDG